MHRYKTREEIDLVKSGGNYGWRKYEGFIVRYPDGEKLIPLFNCFVRLIPLTKTSLRSPMPFHQSSSAYLLYLFARSSS